MELKTFLMRNKEGKRETERWKKTDIKLKEKERESKQEREHILRRVGRSLI